MPQATALQRQEAGDEELQQLLASFRQQQDVLDSCSEEAAVASADARRFMQALVQVLIGLAGALQSLIG